MAVFANPSVALASRQDWANSIKIFINSYTPAGMVREHFSASVEPETGWRQ